MKETKTNSTLPVLLFPERVNVKWLYALLAVVSFLLYSNTLEHDYAYDDYSVIKNNSLVTNGIAAIPQIMSTPYRWGYFVTSNDTYRPLSLVMFAIEYQVFDGVPHAHHFINVLLYIVGVLLLFTLFRRVFYDANIMVLFSACLLFTAHPIHTEVVANIKSRDELLCFCFSIYALILFADYAKTVCVRKLLTASLMFFLSLLSKETSIVFLLIGPLFVTAHYIVKARLFEVVGSMLLVAIVFMVIRLSVLNFYNVHHTSDVAFIDNFLVGVPFLNALATAFLILGKYLLLLFVPYSLVCDYSFNGIDVTRFSDWRVWMSITIYVGLVTLSIYRLIKDRRDMIALGIILFVVPLTLFSNILFFIGAAMAERFLFLSSAGFCLALTAAFAKMLEYRKTSQNDLKLNNTILFSIVTPIVLLFAVITINRNADWKNNLTLFSTDVEKMPNNARLNFFIGNELVLYSREESNYYGSAQLYLDSGVKYLHKALSIYPEYKDAKLSLANSFFLNKMYDSAEYYYLNVLDNVMDLDALHNLDILYYTTSRFSQSISVCRKIIATKPEMISAYKNMGVCYIKLSQYDSAIGILKAGIQVFPDSASLYQTTAIAYGLNNNNDSALKYELLARDLIR